MSWRQYSHPVAGLLVGVSLLVLGSAMAVAILGVAHPIGGGPGRGMVFLVLPPVAFYMGFAMWVLRSIIVRRPLASYLRSKYAAKEYRLGHTAACWGLVVVMACVGIAFAIGSVRSDPAGSIVECRAFAPMSLPLGLLGFAVCNLGNLSFLWWWRDQQGEGLDVGSRGV